MKKHIVWILAFLVLWGWLSFFLVSLAGADSKTFWSALSGDDLYIRSIVVDSKGNIWTEGERGIAMFDGVGWVRYGKACGGFMAADRMGNMWFGFRSGSYSSGGRGRPLLYRFDGLHWKVYGTSDALLDRCRYPFASDNAGNIWLGTQDGGIGKFDGATVKTYSVADGLKAGTTSVAIDRAGNMWCGTKGAASRFDGKNWTTFDAPETGLARNVVRSITIGKGNDIWFTTLRGVSKFDGKDWTRYTPADGLADDRVWASAMDKDGNMWFGTDKGVSMFDGTSWITYTTEDGLVDNSVWAIASDKMGNLWFGTDAGVSVLGEPIELPKSRMRVRALAVKVGKDGQISIQEEPTVIEVWTGDTNARSVPPMVMPGYGIISTEKDRIAMRELGEPVSTGYIVLRISSPSDDGYGSMVLGESLFEMDALEEKFQQTPKEKKGKLFIHAAEDVSYSQIDEILEEAKRACFENIGFTSVTRGGKTGREAFQTLQKALLEKKNECFLPSEDPVLLIDLGRDTKCGTIGYVIECAGRWFHNFAIKPLEPGKPPVLIRQVVLGGG